MFVDVRRGGGKNFCSSMFVVVRRCSSLFVVGCPCGRDLFVDVRRRTSTNKTDEHFVRRRTKNVRLHTMPRGGGGGGGGGGETKRRVSNIDGSRPESARVEKKSARLKKKSARVGPSRIFFGYFFFGFFCFGKARFSI